MRCAVFKAGKKFGGREEPPRMLRRRHNKRAFGAGQPRGQPLKGGFLITSEVIVVVSDEDTGSARRPCGNCGGIRVHRGSQDVVVFGQEHGRAAPPVLRR